MQNPLRFSSVVLALFLAMIPFHGLRAQSETQRPLLLHVDQASETAVTHNPTVLEARMQWLIKQRQESAAWGDFEPAIVSSYAESGLDRLNNAAEQVAELGRSEYSETKSQFDVGVEGKFFTGATYHLGYMLSQTQSVFTNGAEYESTIGVSINQPILKGFTHSAPFASIQIARLDTLIAFHTFRKQLIAIASSAESAYWDLALSQERRGLAAESVGIAREILKDSQERVRVGKMSELDSREAETELNIRLAEQVNREQDELEAATRLQLLLAQDQTSDIAGVAAADPLLMADWDIERFRAESGGLQAKAMALQPEIAIRRAQLEEESIRLDYSLDQQLPELNAKATYGFQGLGDSPDSALQRLNSQGFPSWSVGVELRIPVLGDIKARNTEQAARMSKALALSQVRSTEKEISMSVEALVRRVIAHRKQIDSARAESGFKKQLLDVELVRFDAGQSDVRKLYQLEDDLSQARAREMESYNRFRKALLDLSATSGTILGDRGWETVRDNRIILTRLILKRDGK